MPTSAPRLPGLRFETARPPAVPGLPRMDVAAFVGFASAGPVGVPVAVDDEVRFRAVFGPDLPLAWDAARGEMVYAHLAPAVREFFRNGGRRCWIVRVADEAALEAAAFRVPGLLHGRGRTLNAAYLLAGSPGSWADGMSLNATLRATLLSGVTVEGERGIRPPFDSPGLLRLEWPESGTVAFFPPHPGAGERDRAADERGTDPARPFSHAYWFTRATWKELQPVGHSAAWLAGPREEALQPVGWQVTDHGPDPRLEITLSAQVARGLQPGCWIRVHVADLHHPAAGDPHGAAGPGEAVAVDGDPSLAVDEDRSAVDGGSAGTGAHLPVDAGPSASVDDGRFISASVDDGRSVPVEEDRGGAIGRDAGGVIAFIARAEDRPEDTEDRGRDIVPAEIPALWANEPPSDATPWVPVDVPPLAVSPDPEAIAGGHPGGGQGGGGHPHGDEGGGEDEEGSGHAGAPALLGKRAYLLVDEVRRDAQETVVTIRRAWRTLHHRRAPAVMDVARAQASLVSLELWTRRGDGTVVRLADLGLVPGHPRFLGGFPPDQVLFAPAEELARSTDADPAHGPLSTRRMELAAPDPRAYAPAGAGGARLLTRDDPAPPAPRTLHPGEAPDGRDDDEGDGGEGFEAYLPLGVPTLPRDDFYQAAQTSGRTPLERDGLAEFGAGLFLDPLLRTESAETLLDASFFHGYVAEPPRPPVRMHALLPVDEVSLLAVPDAVHPGWALRTVDTPPPAPEAPYLVPMEQPDGEGRITVHWGQVGGALEYTLEDSPDPRFRDGVRVTSIPVPQDGHPWRVTILRPRPCPDRLYFRIRVRTRVGVSPWSSTLLLDLPADAFQGCGVVPLSAPVVTSFIPAGERLWVYWAEAAEDEALREARAAYERVFRVEVSPEPTFSLPELLHEGTGRGASMWTPETRALFFRAASWLREREDAEEGRAGRIVEESPWSATLGWTSDAPSRWETLPPAQADPSVVRDVHTAMLRFCAARSDCFAVLALPRHHREPGALAHAEALVAALGGVQAPGDVGARTLSFGALYHPWTVVRTTVSAAPLRAIPPDGATCGVMATRANELGAWAAPANQPLAGVAVLDPALPESVRASFLGRRVNAVAPFPRGFMSWSEETLSPDPELRGVGVRRLLILLRRLALREGATYLFAPHDRAFRRLVQRQFDALLGDLYLRGAFAGASHAEGYRVVTDDSVNPPQGVEQGRLVVELRIAPSRPLSFLTVRLVQTGAGITVQEG